MSEELKVKVVTGTFGWRHKVLGILSEEADEVEFMTKYLQENRLNPYLYPSEFQVTHGFDRFGKRPNCPEVLLYEWIEREDGTVALRVKL